MKLVASTSSSDRIVLMMVFALFSCYKNVGWQPALLSVCTREMKKKKKDLYASQLCLQSCVPHTNVAISVKFLGMAVGKSRAKNLQRWRAVWVCPRAEKIAESSCLPTFLACSSKRCAFQVVVQNFAFQLINGAKKNFILHGRVSVCAKEAADLVSGSTCTEGNAGISFHTRAWCGGGDGRRHSPQLKTRRLLTFAVTNKNSWCLVTLWSAPCKLFLGEKKSVVVVLQTDRLTEDGQQTDEHCSPRFAVVTA